MASKIVSVDFLQTQNRKDHYTSAFANKCLIVRRGKDFSLKLVFDRNLGNDENIVLHFTLGEQSARISDANVEVPVKSASDNARWSATISKSSGQECFVAVKSPADAAVGKFCLTVESGGSTYKPPENSVYFLFNPWCEDDTVFMPGEAEKNEYILADSGCIYYGSVIKISPRYWNYGQYEDDVLDACMYLLDISGLKTAARKDPVIISRTMSALLNSEHAKGVIDGNWTGDYDGGSKPTSWTGSAAILQQYYKTHKHVNFGQCWVFSGVLTTVLRCLGIPTRSVTTFESAHDTEENLTADIYVNEKGHTIRADRLDSVWNFHVWNDAWMKRPDLPKGYDGWQALDATPQEKSEGIFQCGPCPLIAIRTGEVYLKYDAKFIFAEVNADKIVWKVTIVDGKKKIDKIREDRSAIGKFISTKAINKNSREDITCQYKFDEGSSEERDAVQKACSYLQKKDYHAEILLLPEVKLDIISENTLFPGNPLALAIVVSKDTARPEEIELTIGIQMQTYTSKAVSDLLTTNKTIKIKNMPVTIPLQLPANVYMDALLSTEDEVEIKVFAMSECVQSGQNHSAEKIISFQYPPLTVEMPETAKINQKFTCTITLKNHLSIPLENCKLLIEGLGIFKMETFDKGDVQPGGILKSEVFCLSTGVGEKKILVKFNSKQIKEMSVERMIKITE